ncbi:PhzF family phenazine biosynthesis protein [Gilvimarinus sp. F26214L]|uniref:PhzF family phenazine biosynthesis protein n=1 Tax=Gilvimarinus sp. DZF01 TaxID=3461371 RepID=UPI004045EBCD
MVILQERERRVEFHQAGREILRCGSGTLAAAHLLLRERRHTEPLQLETRAGIVRLRACGEWLGYADRPLSQVPSSRFAEWQSLLGQFLCSCRDVGGDRDYCLAEVRSEANLQALRIDSDALARFSQRALIVTAPSDEPGYDYVLRYFAPQYGNEEDGATGSANVQLGPFWQEKTRKSRLRGRQLSPSGGDFLLQVDGPEVWVFGRTRDLDSH